MMEGALERILVIRESLTQELLSTQKDLQGLIASHQKVSIIFALLLVAGIYRNRVYFSYLSKFIVNTLRATFNLLKFNAKFPAFVLIMPLAFWFRQQWLSFLASSAGLAYKNGSDSARAVLKTYLKTVMDELEAVNSDFEVFRAAHPRAGAILFGLLLLTVIGLARFLQKRGFFSKVLELLLTICRPFFKILKKIASKISFLQLRMPVLFWVFAWHWSGLLTFVFYSVDDVAAALIPTSRLLRAFLVVLVVCLIMNMKQRARAAAAALPKPGVKADDVTRLNSTEVDRVFCVRTKEDIREVLRRARAEGKRVAMRGQRHTMGGQTIAEDGYLIDCRFLRHLRTETLEGVGPVCRCGPGATWGMLIEHLNPQALSPMTMQSYCSFSVGGTIAVNAHGITNDFCMHEAVVEAKAIDADGRDVTCSREENPELFGALMGGYGLFGVMYEVTLKVVPNYKLNMEMLQLKVANFKPYYEKLLRDPTIEVKIGRLDILNVDDINMFVFRRASDHPTVSDLGDGPREASLSAQLLYKWVVPNNGFQRLRYAIEKAYNTALDWSEDESDRNQLMFESAKPLAALYSPLIQVDDTFVLQEFFVPHAQFEEWLGLAKPIYQEKTEHIKLLNTTIRYVRQDTVGALPYAQGDFFAFVLYYRIARDARGDAELRARHERLARLTVGLGGTFYLPYRHHYPDALLLEAYPMWPRFCRLKEKYDPDGLFTNLWWERYSPAGGGGGGGSSFTSPARAGPTGGSLPSPPTTRSKSSRLSYAHAAAAPAPAPAPAGGAKAGAAAAAAAPPAVFRQPAVPSVLDRREDSYFRVVNSPALRKKFVDGFLVHVFNIEGNKSLYGMIAQAVMTEMTAAAGHRTTDLEVYEFVEAKLAARRFQGLLAARRALRQLGQLGAQKEEIALQVVSCVRQLGLGGRLHNYVSFGDHGRQVLPLREKLGMAGKAWVVHDGEGGPAAAAERGALGPVGQYVPVDYFRLGPLPQIPDGGADLITIMMGLHHFKQDQLGVFLGEVFRMLRPGGLFIVREHDARPDLIPLVDVAHATFNVVMGVSRKDEKEEIRAFRPVAEWRKLIASAGFEDTMVFELEEKDPTEDVMLCFVKPPFRALRAAASSSVSVEVMDGEASAIRMRYARASGKKLKTINPNDTFYRMNEWMLVEVVEDFGRYLNREVWFRFPYLTYVALYWGVFAQEITHVAKRSGWRAALGAYGFTMDAVIGGVLTLVFLQFALLALPIWVPYDVFGGSVASDLEYEQVTVRSDMPIDDWKVLAPSVENATEVEGGGPGGGGPCYVLKVPRHKKWTRALRELAALAADPGHRLRILDVSGSSAEMQVKLLVEDPGQISWLHTVPGVSVLFPFELPYDNMVAADGVTRRWLAAAVRIPDLLQVLAELEERPGLTVVQVYEFLGGEEDI